MNTSRNIKLMLIAVLAAIYSLLLLVSSRAGAQSASRQPRWGGQQQSSYMSVADYAVARASTRGGEQSDSTRR